MCVCSRLFRCSGPNNRTLFWCLGPNNCIMFGHSETERSQFIGEKWLRWWMKISPNAWKNSTIICKILHWMRIYPHNKFSWKKEKMCVGRKREMERWVKWGFFMCVERNNVIFKFLWCVWREFVWEKTYFVCQ